MKCPICGGTDMISSTTRETPYIYKGQTTTLDVHGDWCPDCDEMILSDENAAHMESQMTEFQRQVNSEAVNPEFILSVRKKLHLDQKRAAELFGGGVNAFSRYERGKAVPPQSLVVLFQLLDKKPELMDTVMEFAQPRTPSVDQARQRV